MADTFSQIYLQFVFAVQNRYALISPLHKEELQKYMTSLVQNRGAKLLAINCMPDHVHLFVGFKPNILISDFVKEIKVESNKFVNTKGWMKGIFRWQEGYGVFSYSHSHIDSVVKYVLNRKNIIKNEALKTSIWRCLGNLKLLLTTNICLILLILHSCR